MQLRRHWKPDYYRRGRGIKQMKKHIKYQVFVSSTFEDLKDERKEITQAILESNCIPAGMEMFPASNRTQWEVIKNVIDESDIYLVIIAGRYGSEGIDEKGNKVSYTEMEFDYAIETGKPVIALLHEDIGSLPKGKCESSQRKNRKLKNFIDKARTGRMIKKWSNKDNIKSATLTALHAFKEDETCKLNGWVQSKMVGEYEYMVNENEQKTQKILQLQSKLAELQKEESEWIQRYRVLNGENEKLRRIIYNCYFDSDYLKNSEDVEEIIEYWEMRTAIERNHQE